MLLSPGVLPPLPFRRLMALNETALSSEHNSDVVNIFQSITPAWAPGGGSRAFGGHVYAQAAWAASRTVGKGMVIHSVTGFFILPGRIDAPFEYEVRKVRDGSIYSLRSVEAYQIPPESSLGSRPVQEHATQELGRTRRVRRAPCFTATVSFKRREDLAKFVGFRYQTPHGSTGLLRQKYANVLDDKKPEDHPVAPSVDATWWSRIAGADPVTQGGQKFPGVDIRKVDMTRYNAGLGNPNRAGEWRQLSLYKLIEDDEKEDHGDCETSVLNMHASAHLYASDRNSLFLVPYALGFEDRIVELSSLSLTVIFHGDPARLSMCTGQGEPVWFMQEGWTEQGGLNRGCHESRLWRLTENGEDEVIATTKQDGVVRVPTDPTSLDITLQSKGSKMGKTSKGKL